ncbi:discoidin domain-containing protein [Fodinicola acaciae]|uniref:discoidin domain-containing protein n=1 Tax=Fodinicola acaciae TaxID=2681555 RepID=UPI0013CF915C|nr:discoidin domain-containing protein [Fodinicola acaciae]
MRRLRVPIGAVTILLACCLVGPPVSPAQAAPAVRVWTEPSSTNVFQDSLPTRESGSTVDLDTARNEYESGQIVIRPSAGLTVTSVGFTDLVNGGNKIAASNLSYNFVTYQKLDANTHVYPPVRKAPGDFPDNLSNRTQFSVPTGVTQSIWVTAYVPKGLPAGRYAGTVTVHTDKGDLAPVAMSVDVRAVDVPDTKDGTFNDAMWNTFNGELSWKPDGDVNTIEAFYHYKRFTPQWRALMNDVVEQMRRHRINNVTLPPVGLLIDGGSTVDSAGHYTFNWSRFDEALRIFDDNNVLKRLEGFWVSADTDNWRTKPNFDGIREVEIISRGADGTGVRDYAPWESADAKNFIDQFIPELKKHLENTTLKDNRKVSDVYWMHIGDEPITDEDKRSWLGIASQVHSHWPGLKLGDAIFAEPNASELARSMDVMIPDTLNYNGNPEPYDTLRRQGKELWFYQCIIPVDNYLNRFIDQPQWNQRLTIWYAYSRQATGYLHYSMDGWAAPVLDEDGKGDHSIVWPDAPNNRIESSIRFDSLRDGIEDYELLNILGRTNPGLAHDLSYALIQNADTYVPDTSYMARIRRLMLDAAGGKPVVATDLARTGTATASSGAAGNAIDGDGGTAWKPTSGSGSQWWQVDLGRQVQLDGVRLDWGPVYGKAYKVQVSYDGSRWTDAYATTSADSGDDFVGINGKARYVRLAVSAGSDGATAYALNSFEVAGFGLAKANLLGGRTYKITDAAGNTVTPDNQPDSGIESTDGVLADAYPDGRTYGFGPGHGTVNVTFDLGSQQPIGNVRMHAYQEYPAYRPDQVQVSVSTDGSNYTSLGTLTATNDQSRIWYDFGFASSTARFVRLTFTKSYNADAEVMLIDEIEAY